MSPQKPLLPDAQAISRLAAVGVTPDVAMMAIRAEHDRSLTYALRLGLLGAACFLALIVGYVYLVIQGHPHAAGWLLGTGALAIVGQLIAARLE
jgi:hypothetical protein